LAFLNELNLALGYMNLLGFSANLLVMADLLGRIHTFPVRNIGTLSVINIMGHRGWLPVASLFRDIIAHSASLLDILALLSVSWLANPILMSFALKIRDFLACDFWDKRTDTSGLGLTVSPWNLLARLDGENLAVILGNLYAVKSRNFLALLLREGAALLLWSLSTNGFGNRPTLLLVHSVALFLQGVVAFLLGHVLALLYINLSTLPVRIVNISADLLGNLLAVLFKNSLTLTMRNLFAFLFGNLLAFLLLDDMAILGRHMITHLFIHKLANLLVDDIAF